MEIGSILILGLASQEIHLQNHKKFKTKKKRDEIKLFIHSCCIFVSYRDQFNFSCQKSNLTTNQRKIKDKKSLVTNGKNELKKLKISHLFLSFF